MFTSPHFVIRISTYLYVDYFTPIELCASWNRRRFRFALTQALWVLTPHQRHSVYMCHAYLYYFSIKFINLICILQYSGGLVICAAALRFCFHSSFTSFFSVHFLNSKQAYVWYGYVLSLSLSLKWHQTPFRKCHNTRINLCTKFGCKSI